MKEIRFSTRRGQDWVRVYSDSKMFCLDDAYGRWSDAKERAYYDCVKCAIDEGGSGFKIIAANCSCFSCGWVVDGGLRVETACNSYLIKFNR